MRYTRVRQMAKLNKNWRKAGNIPIEVACKRVCPEDLDPTFKWHREYGPIWSPWGLNFIEFQGKLRLVKF